MAIINTNISAIITQQAMAKNDRAMQTTMERLSTGKSVNSAQDDAAGIAVSSRMTSQIKGLDQAVQNAGDAISMIQTADGASIELGNMMQRMRELAVQATNGTVTTTDQGSLDLEFQQLKAEIARVAKNSQWNGDNILDGTAGTASNGTATYQIGANAQQVMDVSFGDWSLNAPTTNIAAVYSSSMTSAQAQSINGPVVLSDGINTLKIDYSSSVHASPASLTDLVSDITSHEMYAQMNVTVAVNAVGNGIDITYDTAKAQATPPTLTAVTGYTRPVQAAYTLDVDDTDADALSALSFNDAAGTTYTVLTTDTAATNTTEKILAAINGVTAMSGWTATMVANGDNIVIEKNTVGADTLTVANTGATPGFAQTRQGVTEVLGSNVAGSITVSTAGKSVTGVAAIYRTSLSDANVAAIDGNVVFSDGENKLTVDASSITTIDALASAVSSHADHADLDFTVSKTTAVAGVKAAYTFGSLDNADINTLAGAGTPISISNGTNTITISPSELGGTNTLANLVTAITNDPGYASFGYVVTDNGNNGGEFLLLTASSAGVRSSGPTITAGATHAVANTACVNGEGVLSVGKNYVSINGQGIGIR